MKRTLVILALSIIVPFALGALLALFLFPRVADESLPFTGFVLFMGAAMSVTAFPVLARILEDRGLTQTSLGSIALTCAAVDDVTAWCMLAFVVGVARASTREGAKVERLFLDHHPRLTRKSLDEIAAAASRCRAWSGGARRASPRRTSSGTGRSTSPFASSSTIPGDARKT